MRPATAKFRTYVAAALALAAMLAFPAASMALAFQAASQPEVKAESAHGSAESKQAEAKPEHEAGETKPEKEDPTEALIDALRHSGPVKAIGRITGLDAGKAYWLSTVLNFLIVAAVLWLMLSKMLPGAFRNRTEAIQKRIEEARRSGEEARVRLAGIEERLSRLDSDIAQMRDEAAAAGKADEERIMKAVEEERRRIVEAASQEIAMAATSAQRELKAFVAELAIGMAEKKISVGKAADQALVREFTARLGKEQ